MRGGGFLNLFNDDNSNETSGYSNRSGLIERERFAHLSVFEKKDAFHNESSVGTASARADRRVQIVLAVYSCHVSRRMDRRLRELVVRALRVGRMAFA